LDTTLPVLSQQFEPVRNLDRQAVDKKSSRAARGLRDTALTANQIDWHAPNPTVSGRSKWLDRGVRTLPAVETELFQLLRSTSFGIVLKGAKAGE
jgi:hypothetical protein